MGAFKIEQLELDNGIYERIRKQLVSENLLPDVTLYDLNTDQGVTDYAAALKAIPNVIEVFNVGGAQSRGTLETNSIIIDRSYPKMAKSGVGFSNDYDYNESTGKYDKKRQASIKYDIPFVITYICKSNFIADKIESVLRSSLQERVYVSSINDAEEKTGDFWLIRTGEFDTSGKNYIERGLNFEARNIDLIGDKKTEEIVPFDIDKFCLELGLTNVIFNDYIDMIGIDINGDLWYSSERFTFELDENGDLIINEIDGAEIYVDNLGDAILLID